MAKTLRQTISRKVFDEVEKREAWERKARQVAAPGMLPAEAKKWALGWEGMEPIDNDDFGGLYRLQYTPGNFVPEVTVARQGDLFQKQCFLEADSPLPAVRLPQSGW